MSEQKVLSTPKFLTTEVAEKAIRQFLYGMCASPVGDLLKRRACHIVVLVPSLREDAPYVLCFPYALCEVSIGDKSTWTGEYDRIAKAKQSSSGMTEMTTEPTLCLISSSPVTRCTGEA